MKVSKNKLFDALIKEMDKEVKLQRDSKAIEVNAIHYGAVKALADLVNRIASGEFDEE